jgi:hypothetical protein
MRRWRRRIVCCRRRTCLVVRALVIRLRRRIGYIRVRALVIRLRRRIGYIRPRVHPLRRSLDRTLGRGQRRAHRRSYILSAHWARRIDTTRQVCVPGTRPLCRSRESAAQNCARSRRCAPDSGKCLRANVGPANRRNVASIPIQRLLMIRSRYCPVVERPRALGNRSTIDYHQPTRQRPRTTRRIKRHRPTWRVDSYHSYRSPGAARITTRRPSPAERVVVPGTAVIREPAPGIAGNPCVPEGRIVRPIPGPIGIPAGSNTGRNPDVALTLDWVPVTVGIQIVPVFTLRIGRVIAHRRLLRCLLCNGLVPILIPVVPGITIDSLSHRIGSATIIGARTDALVLRYVHTGNSLPLHVDRTVYHRHIPPGIQADADDRIRRRLHA